MPKSLPSYLKLHVEDAPPDSVAGVLGDFCLAFSAATGWSLEIEPAAAEPAAAADAAPPNARRFAVKPGLAEDAAGGEPVLIELHKARGLAEAASRMLAEGDRARDALWRREAELAAGVPVTARPGDEAHLAERLAAVLQGGAEAIGCQAAAVYLLDAATTELKMRACWGLPQLRLAEPARPLRGAVADLEALVGHAVVLEDTHLLPHWKVPEPFAAAVCVPISTSSEPLGTLWMFSEHVRDFNEQQTNLVEIIAGRIAAELQREMLLAECVASKQLDRQLLRAGDWQRDHLPNVVPLLDDWQVAGWTSDGVVLSGGFFDWFVPPDGSLAVVLGHASGTLFEAALTVAAMQAAVRAVGQQRHDARQLLHCVNETFWNGSAGGDLASLFYGRIAPESGQLECCAAGDVTAMLVGPHGARSLVSPATPPLATAPDETYPRRKRTLARGDSLVLVKPVRAAGGCEPAGGEFERRLRAALAAAHPAAVEEMVQAARSVLEEFAPGEDHVLLVVRRSSGH